MWMHYGYGWGFPFFPVLWIIFLVIVISLFWRRGHGWHEHSQRDKSPEEILEDRFAKGEIDEDEYKKRLDVLQKHAK